jgi:hypothetical protein
MGSVQTFSQSTLALISYLLANKAALVGASLSVVGGASALVKALQSLTDLLLAKSPNLAKADTIFGKITGWLSAIAHWPLLNALAANPTAEHAAATDAVRGAGASPITKPPAPANAGFVRLLALMVAVYMTPVMACAHLTPLEQQIVDCGTQAVQSQLPAILSQVNGILGGGSVNWTTDLATLLAAGGPAVICAVEAAVTNAEHSATSSQASYTVIARGEAWLTSQNVAFKAAAK